MTSSRQYNRICLFCRTQFVAQKRTTKYCSHRCASRAYKVNKKRQDTIEVNFEEFVKRELMIHTETLLQIQNSISQLLQVARLSNEEYIPVEDYYMVIENYFTENHNKPWRGFVSGEWRGFEEEPIDFGRINLYKLHGSLDWVRLDSGEFKEEEKLNEQDKGHIEDEHSPYLIFGQGTKTFSVEPFFTLIQHFRTKLKEKSYIFVIGYSFFDPYINNLLIDSVKGTSKKLIIINPIFGPEQLKSEKDKVVQLITKDEFLRIQYPDGISDKNLANYIEDIQKNSFYSELPEFNIKKINAESLEFLPIGTKVFFEKYFNNGGEIFIKLISEYESKKADENPFKDN